MKHGDASLGLPATLDLSIGQDIVLGVRPEHLRVDDAGGLMATVEVVEPMGSETHLTCVVGQTEIRLIEAANIDTQPGATICLSFDLTKAHVFDQTSQARLIGKPLQ